MQLSQWFSKTGALRFAVRVFYYSGFLKCFHFLFSAFQPKKRRDGRVVFPFVKRRRLNNLQILVYHRVNDEGDLFFPAIPTDQFARQMEYLSANRLPLCLQEAVQRLRYNELPERAVVVTFDDGYRDNFLYAYPILQRYGIPATIFLASGAIGPGKMIWHDRVFRAFRKTKVPALEHISGIEKSFPLMTLEQKLAAQGRVLQLIWELPDGERDEWINRLEEHFAVNKEKEPVNAMLTWGEVLAMAEGRISFGSHTISHPILSRLSDDKLYDEIGGSKKVIESNTNRPVHAFAYPVGRKQDFNDRVKAIVQEAGYLCAVTTTFGVNEPGQDVFELRRATPWETDIPSFAARLCWYQFIGNC